MTTPEAKPALSCAYYQALLGNIKDNKRQESAVVHECELALITIAAEMLHIMMAASVSAKQAHAHLSECTIDAIRAVVMGFVVQDVPRIMKQFKPLLQEQHKRKVAVVRAHMSIGRSVASIASEEIDALVDQQNQFMQTLVQIMRGADDNKFTPRQLLDALQPLCNFM